MSASLRVWLRVGGGLLVLAALAWQVRADAALAALASVDLLAILAALGIGLVTTVLCAWRWRVVAGAVGLWLPVRTAVADYYRAVFLNAVLPAGVLGDVHRAVCHGRETGEHGRAARAVVLERVAGQIVLLGSGAVVLLAMPASLVGAAPHALTAVVVAIAAVGATAAVGLRAVYLGAEHWAWCATVRRRVGVLVDDARASLFHRQTGSTVFLLSLAAIGGHVTLFLVAARIATPETPSMVVLPIAVLALVAMSLPLNVAGWGPREAVAVLAFGAVGLGADLGFATAVTYGALALVASLPGLGVLLLRRILTTPPSRSVPEGLQVTGEGTHQVGERGAAPVGGRP